jgi:tetratricopeptide (TPR) repeat protein
LVIFKEKKALLSVALIALAGLLAYGNSLKGAFLWDDLTLVQNNPFIKDWSYLPQIFTHGIKTGAGEVTNFYRPSQIFVYLINYSLGQLNVFGYHLTNVLVHILVALSLYGFVRLLFEDEALSRLTALLFVVHPVHTEAVSYISGLADPLAALFMLVCLYMYVRNLTAKTTVFSVAMVASYVLALLSRENSLIVPLLLGVYHAAFKERFSQKQFILLVSVAVGYMVWRGILFGGLLAQEVSYPPLGQRIPGFFVALVEYLRLLVVPFGLHMEYGGFLFDFTEPRVFIGVFLFCALGGYALWNRRRNRFIFFSMMWFFMALLPSSNLVPVNAYMAEHWLYLPSMGFFLIVAWGLTALLKDKRLRMAAIMLIPGLLIFYSGLTWRQNAYWQEPVAFYRRMLQLAPHSSKLYNNLAMAYHEAGKDEELVTLLQNAVEIEDKNAEAFNNLGNAYKMVGKYDEAMRAYERAVELNPRYAGAYYNLGLLLADVQHQNDRAFQLFIKAVDIDPLLYQAYHKIGLIYFDKGNPQEAVAFLEKARKINPDDAQIYRSLGYIYAQTGKVEEAKDMYQRAITLNPYFAEVYHDLCVIHISQGDHRSALGYCDKAAALHYDVAAAQEILRPYR